MSFRYAVVIDAGSSGSRLHIYNWDTSEKSSSVPKIKSNNGWSKKITPGLSSFGSYDGKKLSQELWQNHLEPLMQFTEQIIPKNELPHTPIFIQATAGMRLLSEKQQQQILQTACRLLKDKSQLLVANCRQQLEIIDGETEGLYGWMSLNYLAGNFNNVTHSSAKTLGFMDMGGASAQVAFVPSNVSEIERHNDDLATVRLATLDGNLYSWRVFVSTWLGFGANQARRRYLESLAAVSGTTNSAPLKDPCLPKGLSVKEQIAGVERAVDGAGDYDTCLDFQYPLLLKHLPCVDDPCLFNGVHVPRIDFAKDQFVGVSEFWYTINDIFDLGGTYSFKSYNKALKSFCESDWTSEILDNYSNNRYNGIKLDYLKQSCFKGAWVINVLHEGFGLPRVDFEYAKDSEKFTFKSAASINGVELSWTLGKALLYASSQVPLVKQSKSKVGMIASDAGEHHGAFIPGDFTTSGTFSRLSKTEKIHKINGFFGLFLLIVTVFFCFVAVALKKYGRNNVVKRVGAWSFHLHRLQRRLSPLTNLIGRYFFRNSQRYMPVEETFDANVALEEGLGFSDENHFKSSHSFINVNSGNFYKNFTASNSVASLYSQASLHKGNPSSFDNKSSGNLSAQAQTDLELKLSPQLRSRASLFNLAGVDSSKDA